MVLIIRLSEFSVTDKDERPGPEELTMPPGPAARQGVTPAVHAQAPGALLKVRLMFRPPPEPAPRRSDSVTVRVLNDPVNCELSSTEGSRSGLLRVQPRSTSCLLPEQLSEPAAPRRQLVSRLLSSGTPHWQEAERGPGGRPARTAAAVLPTEVTRTVTFVRLGSVRGPGASSTNSASASNVNAQTPFGNFQQSNTNANSNQSTGGRRPCFGFFCRPGK
ncbi:hypothetical protein FJT64_009501 [Amphibalanus amphitrite]|uniref:Uncharacterized protein n=1 Tax=Amphibalanus amphitrite TaxID=1232801 RepID=A0A6A4VMC6_AMPAM|nr:hypothetical protein FJT64_009501 [Amphibalanus amphitrite]